MDMDELRQKLEDIIFWLNTEIYDSKGEVRSSKYFKSEKDKEDKISLLAQYKEALKNIYEGNMVNDLSLLEIKPLPNSVLDLMQEKNKKTFEVSIKTENDLVSYLGVSSQIQYPNGKFFDAIVIYRGYSEKYQKEFIIYTDSKKKSVNCTIIETKNNYIMNDIAEISEDMAMDFYNIFISANPNSIDLESFPPVIRCLGVEQLYKKKNTNRFSEIIKGVDIIKERISKHNIDEQNINETPSEKEDPLKESEDEQLVKTDTTENMTEEKVNFQSIQDEDGMYRYKLSMLPSVSYLITLIKKANSDILVQGKIIENSYPGSSEICILEMSKSVEEINIPEFEILSGYSNDKLNSTSEIMKRLSPIKEEQFMSKYHPTYETSLYNVPERFINYYIADLKEANKDANITVELDRKNSLYKIVSDISLEKLKPVLNPLGKDLKYEKQFGYDQNGYLFVQSQKLVTYKVDDNNVCHEERPYYINENIMDIKDASLNNAEAKVTKGPENVSKVNDSERLEKTDVNIQSIQNDTEKKDENIRSIQNEEKKQTTSQSGLTNDEIAFLFKEFKKLEQENQELKKQLEQYKKQNNSLMDELCVYELNRRAGREKFEKNPTSQK